jgi:hypothetical protein
LTVDSLLQGQERRIRSGVPWPSGWPSRQIRKQGEMPRSRLIFVFVRESQPVPKARQEGNKHGSGILPRKRLTTQKKRRVQSASPYTGTASLPRP